MSVNLINEKDLNQYLADIVYHGEKPENFSSGQFKDIDFVENNKDAIVRAMLMQYVKHRLRSHLLQDKPEHRRFLTEVKSDEPDLPKWAQQCLVEGKAVHRFKAVKVPAKLTEKITMVRDFLYAKAEHYINDVLARGNDTQINNNQKIAPRIRMDFLKTQEAYDSFDKAVTAAETWHNIMAQKTQHQKANNRSLQKSLRGCKEVMDFGDGWKIMQLKTSDALDFESERMGHCVGQGEYDQGVQNGKIRIYSLRDAQGEPHATLEIKNKAVIQCKGAHNKLLCKEDRAYVQEFIKAKQFKIKKDQMYVGLLQQDGEYYDIFNLPHADFVINGDLNIDFADSGQFEWPDFKNISVIEGDLYMEALGLKKIPNMKHIIVKGDFSIGYNNIRSLEGSPKEVGGGYYCYNNRIKNWNGISKKINGVLWCYNNELESLENGPETVGDEVCVDEKMVEKYNLSGDSVSYTEILTAIAKSKVAQHIAEGAETEKSAEPAKKQGKQRAPKVYE